MQKEINEAVKQFIKEHRTDDVRQLALRKEHFAKHYRCSDRDLDWALKQIHGWQIARKKLPAWSAITGLFYPVHLSMEQASSEETASYKATVAVRWAKTFIKGNNDIRFIDLTGGFGVDFTHIGKAISQSFPKSKLIYIEPDGELCEIARNNFPLLNLPQAEILCATAQEWLNGITEEESGDISRHTIIYIDPARRNKYGGKVFNISDCQPDIIEIAALLAKKAQIVIAKLSPMLDWKTAIQSLNSKWFHVKEVHAIGINAECKELLIVLERTDYNLSATKMPSPTVYCLCDNTLFSYEINNHTSLEISKEIVCNQFLYDPHACIRKMGAFSAISEHFKIKALSHDAHLFICDKKLHNFPGRCFKIEAIYTFSKQDLRMLCSKIKHANIAVRGLPMKAEDLRRRLKLHDGGDDYIFGATLSDKSHILIHCKKA